MKKIILFLLVLLIPGISFAGITEDQKQDISTRHGYYVVHKYTATADGSGDIAITNIGAFNGCISMITFDLAKVIFLADLV